MLRLSKRYWIRDAGKKFSKLKDFLFDYQIKKNENPIFKIPTSNIEILKDPLDFYSALNAGVGGACNRVCLSSLYWGVGVFEEHLIKRLGLNCERNSNLRIRMLMDLGRGTREYQTPKNGYLSSMHLLDQLKDHTQNRDVEIGMLKCNTSNGGILSEIKGVHHAKFAVFDNSVILTGANFEEQYFLNRRDRYWIINDCKELADYLEDYIQDMIGASEQINSFSGIENISPNKSPENMTKVFSYTNYARMLRDSKKEGNSFGIIEGTQNHRISQVEGETIKKDPIDQELYSMDDKIKEYLKEKFVYH